MKIKWVENTKANLDEYPKKKNNNYGCYHCSFICVLRHQDFFIYNYIVTNSKVAVQLIINVPVGVTLE